MQVGQGKRAMGIGMVVALFASRVLLASRLDLGRDEVAYWYWAWHALDASYSWVTVALVRLSTAWLSDGAFTIRLPGLLAGFGAVTLVGVGTRRLGGSRATALAAAVAVAASPWHLDVGVFAHPDAFLTLFALAFAVAAAGPPGGKALIVASACAGLAALAKLPGAWILGSATLFVWRSRRGSGAATFGAAAILLVAVLALLRDLDGYILAGVREFGRFAAGVSLFERGAWTLAEILVDAGPALLVFAVAGAMALRDRKVRDAWPAWTAAAALFAFFVVFFFRGQSKGNWFLPSLALLVPPGAVALERAGRARIVGWLAAGGCAVTLAFVPVTARPDVVATMLRREPLSRLDASYARRAGLREATVAPTRTWSERLAEYAGGSDVEARITGALAAGATGVASDDYGLAFRAAHAAGRDVRVFLPEDRVFRRSCGGWPQAGETVVFASPRAPAPWVDWRRRFRECRSVPAVQQDMTRTEGSRAVPVVYVVECIDFLPGDAP